jgi:uncharacterized protein
MGDISEAGTAREGRVVSIDVVRGFALLGILVMNVQAFAMPSPAYFNPLAYGTADGLDAMVWGLTRLFFDGKFLSLFSTLFGASLVLAGGGARAVRRLGWLVVFGLVHGYALFVGDILFTYGTVGLLALRAREWPVPRLVRTGLALVAVACATPALLGLFHDSLPTWLRAELARTVSAEGVARELAVFRSGWFEQLPLRAELSFANQVLATPFESGWQAGGCMLLGMAAVRTRFFDGATSLHRYGSGAFVAGLGVTGLGMWVSWRGGFAPRAWLLGQALHLAGCAGVTFGWLTVLVALARRASASGLVSWVARLGRVAFTAYIVQSVAGMLVFGGQGLGQYGHWSRSQLLVAPFVLWGAQVLLAVAWTSRHRAGPLEALWRRLYAGGDAERVDATAKK